MATIRSSKVIAPRPGFSWSAVFAGAILSLVIYLVLSVLGAAIGASVVEPMRDGSLRGFSVAAGIWTVVSTLISLIVGAYFAGRSAPAQGWLHGVLTWAIMTLASTYLLTAAVGTVISGAGSVVGKGLSVAGEGAARAAPALVEKGKEQLQESGVQLDFDSLRSQLDTLLRQTGKPELNPSNLQQQAQQGAQQAQTAAQQGAQQPQNADDDLARWFQNVKRSAQPTLAAADKDALVNIIVARTGKSRDEAQQIADNYERTYNQAVAQFQQAKDQAEQKAREMADIAAKRFKHAAWWTFIVMVVGAVISGAAGQLGYRRRPAWEETSGGVPPTDVPPADETGRDRLRDTRGTRDPRDTRDTRDTRDPHDPRDTRDPRDPRNL